MDAASRDQGRAWVVRGIGAVTVAIVAVGLVGVVEWIAHVHSPWPALLIGGGVGAVTGGLAAEMFMDFVDGLGGGGN